MNRRHFTFRMTALCFASAWAGRGNRLIGDDLLLTPAQTRGPFYPIPDIEKQDFFDFDLTRKSPESPMAEGEAIAIRGSVVDFSDKALDKVWVEVWQASSGGRYNHPEDRADTPIDPNFQYWGRMQTSDDGQFAFKTVLPGKYPGRTPHIHFRIAGPGREELATQLYFEKHAVLNQRDGIYNSVSPEQRKIITTDFESMNIDPKDAASEKLPTGYFRVVLGPKKDSKSTPDM
jgi:protocatechuate 3,4-dioxygenase, beta subunit